MSYDDNNYSFRAKKPTKLVPVYSAIIFVLFLLTGCVIWFEGINQQLFVAINQQHGLLPNQIWLAINLSTYSKFFIAPALLILISLVFRRDKIINVIFLIGAYFVSFLALKHLFGEARPYIALPQDSFFWLNKYEDSVKSAYLSFPSGHTGNMAIFAFGLNYLIFADKKIMQFLMLLLVILVGLARICTGWHWPLDVLASGLIGYVLVKIAFYFNLSNLFRKKHARY